MATSISVRIRHSKINSYVAGDRVYWQVIFSDRSGGKLGVNKAQVQLDLDLRAKLAAADQIDRKLRAALVPDRTYQDEGQIRTFGVSPISGERDGLEIYPHLMNWSLDNGLTEKDLFDLGATRQ
jgi:hypothetical protein